MTPSPRSRMALLTFMFTALLLGATRQCKAEDYERRILWKNAEHTEAAFLPEVILNEGRLAELPLSRLDREGFEWRLEFRRNYPGAIPVLSHTTSCTPLERPLAQGSLPYAKSLEGLAAERQLAIAGKVVDVVPGFSAVSAETARAIYLAADTILADTSGTVVLGQVLAYVELGGDITVDGVRLCTDERMGFRSPRVGDRLLFLGVLSVEDELYLHGTHSFPVEGDTIISQPFGDLKPGPLPSLRELRETLGEDKEGRAP